MSEHTLSDKSPLNPIVLLLLAAAGYLALGYSMQRAVMFPNPPVPLDDIAAKIPGLEKIWLEQPDGRVEAWFLPPYKDTDDPTAVLLFTHGNGERGFQDQRRDITMACQRAGGARTDGTSIRDDTGSIDVRSLGDTVIGSDHRFSD